MANSVDPDQTAPIGCLLLLNLSVMVGNYLQQTTSADNIKKISDAFFSWRFKG